MNTMPEGAANAVGRGRNGGDLAHYLAPALKQACDGRLSDIRWFLSDWQRGGAATGFATFAFENGKRDVVVKLPVGPIEHRATTKLAATDAPTPRVAAHGVELGGYDLAWLVLERLPGDPLAKSPERKTLLNLAHSAAEFWKQTTAVLGAHSTHEPEPDWDHLCAKARDAIHVNHLPDEQRWNNGVKMAQRNIPALLDRWSAQHDGEWRHGDLHPGNAMLRPAASVWGQARCVLIDLAEVRPGSWIEDAVSFERLYWGREDKLAGFKPTKELARARKRAGLPVDENWRELADARTVLLAAATPASLARDGDPKHLAGAIDALEHACKRLGL